ncbi:hypothetical protein F4820DRAFT_358391 [Hypoxylon rubiginosum]|uniref:Uncharacterized protein n=1 Tax=Hypoxylon rubiginosum TaxID=110542 RepID=A0ACB9YXS1_9PEZI|nr:hypothetical protein F4820DRAFT_358391 [Hypoxylon rubiginosum]
MASTANQLVQLPSPFAGLPNELLAEIWKFAAESAAATFKRHHRNYERIWTLKFQHPYVTFIGRELTRSEADSIQTLFFTLLQTNRRTRYFARRHVDMVCERNMPPKLVLKSIDKFVFEGEAFKCLISASSVSDKSLRDMAGVTNVYNFPGVLGQRFEQHLAVLSTVSNVVVPSSVFIPSNLSRACHQLLLRLPLLKTIYVQHGTPERAPTDFLDICRPSNVYTNSIFIEHGEIRGGSFQLTLDNEAAFKSKFSRRFSQILRRSTDFFTTLDINDRRVTYRNNAWYYHETWKTTRMDLFLSCLGPFIAKGINCVVVSHCHLHIE